MTLDNLKIVTGTDDQEGFIGEGIKDHVFVAQTTAGPPGPIC